MTTAKGDPALLVVAVAVAEAATEVGTAVAEVDAADVVDRLVVILLVAEAEVDGAPVAI